ncbi:MAG: hypothetical protein R3F14_14395, partial [Polyangiaceae bacterium]
MRSRQALSSLVVAATILCLAPSSRADEPAPAPKDLGPARPTSEFPWFVSVGAGVGYASVVHPQIVQGGVAAPTFSVHGGYTFR